MISTYFESICNGDSNPTANSTTQIELQLITFENYLEGFFFKSYIPPAHNSAPSAASH